MSWIDTLDRLITDSWMASRDESAAMLDGLLALSLAERWGLFQSRDARLMVLADADYLVLFHSLNAHVLMADAADRSGGMGPVTEEATAVLPTEAPSDERHADADGHHALADHSHDHDQQHDGPQEFAEPDPYPQHPEAGTAPLSPSRWRTRSGIRWLTLATAAATALVLAGAAVAAVVLTVLPARSPGDAGAETLTARLDEVEHDQTRFAKRLVQIDTQLGDLTATVDNRFGATMQAIRLAAAMNQLQSAVDRGSPFAIELDRVAPAASGNPALTVLMTRLAGYAAAGIPTLSALRDRYDQMVPRLTGSDKGPVGRVFAWLGSGFGLIESTETRHFHGVLASIGASLRLGDLSAAMRQLEDLRPYPTEAVDQWLAAARVRLETEAALNAVRQAILSNPTVAPEK